MIRTLLRGEGRPLGANDLMIVSIAKCTAQRPDDPAACDTTPTEHRTEIEALEPVIGDPHPTTPRPVR